MKFNTPPKDGAKPLVSTTLPGKSNDSTSGLPQHRGESTQRSPFIHAHGRTTQEVSANSIISNSDRMLRLAGAMQTAGLQSNQYVLLKAFLPELHEVLALIKSDKAEITHYNSILDHAGMSVSFARRLHDVQKLSNLKPDEKEDLQAVLMAVHAAVPHLESRLEKVMSRTGLGIIGYGHSSYDGIFYAASYAQEEGKISIVTRNTIIQTCSLFSDLKKLEPFFLKE